MKSVKAFILSLTLSALVIISASLFAYAVTSDNLFNYDKDSSVVYIAGKDLSIDNGIILFIEDYLAKTAAFYDYLSPEYIDIPIKKSVAALYTATVGSLENIGKIITSALIQNT